MANLSSAFIIFFDWKKWNRSLKLSRFKISDNLPNNKSHSKSTRKILITSLLLICLCSCSKFDDKISTRVKGTVKYADGSPASGVYVKLVQVFKTYEGTTTSTSLYNIVLIEETNSEGGFDFKFKDDPRPEGFPKDYSDYFLCISREFIDSHIAGDGIGMLSKSTEVEFLRTNDHKVGEKKNKIKTGRKNKIDAIIKN